MRAFFMPVSRRIFNGAYMALISTTYGDTDDSLLKQRTGSHDDEDESVTWVEYYLRDDHENGIGKAGELVHRSAHVTLKKMGEAAAAVAAILG